VITILNKILVITIQLAIFLQMSIILTLKKYGVYLRNLVINIITVEDFYIKNLILITIYYTNLSQSLIFIIVEKIFILNSIYNKFLY